MAEFFFSPSFFYLTIFFPPDFRMLSVSQKYSIEQKMTTLETAKSAKKTPIPFCGSLKTTMNVLNYSIYKMHT